MIASILDKPLECIDRSQLMRVTGRIVKVAGLTVSAEGLPLPIGILAEIDTRHTDRILAQVVGFQDNHTILMPLCETNGIRPGQSVTSCPTMESANVGRHILGRVLNGLGQPIDDKGPILSEHQYPVFADPPPALTRQPIDKPLATGIRAIDGMLTLGGGQRIGLFAGTGVGKSVLMGMITRHTSADVTVIALVGERGREVGDFIRKELGDDGMSRTVMVVSTSDESPVLRSRACFVATAVAEYFRDQGKDVLLLMDSVTRFAMAQRQIGLASGEPPATRGYPPSAFAMLPKMLERAGTSEQGSITGIYTVLTEGDDLNDPVADAVRGVLDGHVWLSRNLANAGHYPAISVLDSVSRIMVDVIDKQHLQAARTVRKVLATWLEIEDLVNIGAYVPGANTDFDVAVKMMPQIREFLTQDMHESGTHAETRESLIQLHDHIEQVRSQLTPNAEPTEKDALGKPNA